MIHEILKQLQPKIRGKLVYLSQFGSHLYGLNTENSDLDFRGVYIPNLDDVILKKDKDEINEELEFLHVKGMGYRFNEEEKVQIIPENTYLKLIKVDVKIFSLQKFITLCSKADTNALDLLFSIEDNFIEKYINYDRNTTDSVIWQLYSNRSKLINTSRLESPVTYAFKQATKYGIKGERYSKLLEALKVAKELSEGSVRDLVQYFPFADVFDDKYVKVDKLKNKDIDEYYLNICGVQHQFNTSLNTFIERLEDKVNKEYTSERTKSAKDGNDWKALSHAIRVLLEIQELLETGNIKFPLRQKDFLLDIKLGKVKREVIDEYFEEHLSGIMKCMEQNILSWKYDEGFWNEFIVNETKRV